jgi:hypothetical protein
MKEIRPCCPIPLQTPQIVRLANSKAETNHRVVPGVDRTGLPSSWPACRFSSRNWKANSIAVQWRSSDTTRGNEGLPGNAPSAALNFSGIILRASSRNSHPRFHPGAIHRRSRLRWVGSARNSPPLYPRRCILPRGLAGHRVPTPLPPAQLTAFRNHLFASNRQRLLPWPRLTLVGGASTACVF